MTQYTQCIFVVPELCNGCKLCEAACSFFNYQEYCPSKSRIRIVKLGDKYMPITECHNDVCVRKQKPECVEVCPTGALISSDLEEAIRILGDYSRIREMQPIFKVIAPWRWPYKWLSSEW